MASRRISSLLSRSAAYYVSLSSSGRSSCTRSGGYRYSTATAINKPIARPLEDNYTKLLINQRFPHAASGEMSSSESNKMVILGVGNCDCGIPAVLRKSWTPNNPGRRFESCKLFNANVKQGCDHFKWYDQNQTEWQKEVITELLTKKRAAFNTAFVDNSKVISCPLKEKNKVNAENEALKIKNNQLAEECKKAMEEVEDSIVFLISLVFLMMVGCVLVWVCWEMS